MTRSAYVILIVGALITGASAQEASQTMDAAGAEARFVDTEGTELGVMTLTQAEDGISISGTLEGITEGEHGFHIHETGECDPATSFESAGAHFAPMGNQHGFDNPEGPHAGDMRNQTADSSGQFAVDVTNDMVSLTEGEDGYLLDEDGSALMVHSQADDYQTDPGGNSGDRIACAVIEPTEN